MLIDNNILNHKEFCYKDIPRKWRVVSDFPLNSSLKKDYKQMRENPLNGEEYTVICDENNVSLNGYEIICPKSNKKLIKKL